MEPEQRIKENFHRHLYFRFEGNLYFIGRLTNRINKTELLFSPSHPVVISKGFEKPISAKHFIFHNSGQFHIKPLTGKPHLQKAPFRNCKTLNDVDYVIFFNLHIRDILTLPVHTQTKIHPIVFDALESELQAIEVAIATSDFVLTTNKDSNYYFPATNEAAAGQIAFRNFVFGMPGTGHDNTVMRILHFKSNIPESDFQDHACIIKEYFSTSLIFKS